MMKEFTFNCPQCQQHVRVPREAANDRLQCPACKQIIAIPTPPPEETSNAAVAWKPQQINGFGAYENTWDFVSKRLWPILGFNSLCLLCATLGVAPLVLLVTALHLSTTWTLFLLFASYAFLIRPLWLGLNLLRFGSKANTADRQVQWGDCLLKIVAANFLSVIIKTLAYLMFILPGIYVSCRLSLFLPELVNNPGQSSIGSLKKSWRLTQTCLTEMYCFWIGSTVAVPSGLMCFVLGMILEKPISALSKEVMYATLIAQPTHQPR